jgi:four helix bundle protein
MAFKFEELKVWDISLNLCNQIDLLTQNFPKKEQFSLTNQIKRAADSVNLNIAEGCIGNSNAEQARFINYSLRSGYEVVTCLFIAQRRGYIDEKEFKKLYEEYEQLCKMLTKLKSSLYKVT